MSSKSSYILIQNTFVTIIYSIYQYFPKIFSALTYNYLHRNDF
jgi:hypothetical protein